MMSYLLQVFIFQLAFLLVYEILLKKETFFNYNRWYLILAPSLAFLLPLLKLEFLSEAIPAENFRAMGSTWLPEVVIGGKNTVTPENTGKIVETSASINWWLVAYAAGALISLSLFILKFRKLRQLSTKSEIKLEQGLRIHSIPNSDIACTFFHKIFIGDEISAKEKQQIIAHELVHIRENHSLDLLFFEILKVIFWFNPLLYIFQNQLATVHEYIADKTAVKISGKKEYYHQLLNTAFSTQNISFINQFFNHSLIKKRILMLQKNKSSKLSKFKFLLVIPLMLGMLTYVACSDDNTAQIQEEESSTSEIIAELKAHLENKESLTKEEKEQFLQLLKKREELLIKESITNAAGPPPPPPAPGSAEDIYNRKYNNSEYDNATSLPFAVIDKVPAFQECDQWEDDARKNCTSSEISKFVNTNFDTSLGKQLGLEGVNRVIVQFRIDENGQVKDIESRAARPELEEEAKRVISELPVFIPGEQNGKPVSVMYSLPIAFKISE